MASSPSPPSTAPSSPLDLREAAAALRGGDVGPGGQDAATGSRLAPTTSPGRLSRTTTRQERPAGLYRLSCYCGPSNTAITFADAPDPTPKSAPAKVHFALSTGQLGFKKSARGGLEPAYQLAYKVFERIMGRDSGQEKALEKRSSRLQQSAAARTPLGSGYSVRQIELTLNGFGPGRQAVFSALMAEEWSDLRPYIARVTDMTPLKVGGTRPKKARRL